MKSIRLSGLAPLTGTRKAFRYAQQNSSPQKLRIRLSLIVPRDVPARLKAPERIINAPEGRACVRKDGLANRFKTHEKELRTFSHIRF